MSGYLALLMLLVTACGRAHPKPAARSAAHVDSLVSRTTAMQRFQAAAHPVSRLSGGASTRDSLVQRFVQATERRDTAELRTLLLDRNEFAYLYFPTTPQGLPPYDLSPELLWFMLSSGSDKGLTRLLESAGGHPLGYTGYTCDSVPSREGRNRVWGPCVVRRHTPKGGSAERLFGLIIERDGRYKFVTYANRL